uniref:Uncharacterized protein n=1 Tax=Romanomermis culicivorax TaxID=13658 RepID=A0A915KQ98_ROMCU
MKKLKPNRKMLTKKLKRKPINTVIGTDAIVRHHELAEGLGTCHFSETLYNGHLIMLYDLIFFQYFPISITRKLLDIIKPHPHADVWFLMLSDTHLAFPILCLGHLFLRRFLIFILAAGRRFSQQKQQIENTAASRVATLLLAADTVAQSPAHNADAATNHRRRHHERRNGRRNAQMGIPTTFVFGKIAYALTCVP